MSSSFLASGTLKSVLSLCLTLSTIISPVFTAPLLSETSQPLVPRSLNSLLEPRAAACNGTGVILTNRGATKSFSFWTNNPDYSRTKLQTVNVASGGHTFVPLNNGWAGTVQRGEFLPATWVELNMAGTAWGDVSLQQGCDGGATLASTTGGTTQGFTENINESEDVPASAFFNPDTQGSPCYSGQCTTKAKNVLDTTLGNYWEPRGANDAATNYIVSKLGGQTKALEKAFIGKDWTTTPQVTSSNNCMAVTFY